MTTLYLLLMPREVELLTRPIGEGEYADLLRGIVANLNKISGELTMTGDQFQQVRRAVTHWRLGYQRQFQAILQAAERHP